MESRNWIGGEWVTPQGETMGVWDPSQRSEQVGVLHLSEADEMARACDAAHKAARGWAATPLAARGEHLRRLADVVEAHQAELAELGSREMGKPITEMVGEVARGVQILRYYAGEGMRAVGSVIPHSQPQVLQYTTRVPLGVVGVITPWNFPVAIPLWKVAPALICGNTVVWKPAEDASLTAMRLTELLAAGGLPAGALNLVIGRGSRVGQWMVEEGAVDGISFTGSAATGMGVASQAARRNIKCQVEMGGKNAAVVLADANLALAVPAIVSGAFRSAGQKCTATSRIIVDGAIFPAFEQALAAAMAAVRVGAARDPQTYVGPVASLNQFRKVTGYEARARRARTIAAAPQDGVDWEAGYYVRPTVVADVAADDVLVQDEIFGPLAVALPARDFDEAVALCNQTVYGLSAAVFTANLAQGLAFMEQAAVGMVRVNQETAGVEYAAPFGGMKQSSTHSREQGSAALDFYSETKTCAVYYGP